MQYHQQLGVNDCGPTCLAMVASHYKSFVNISEVRKFCKTDYMGTNFAGLISAAEKLGFTAKAFKGELVDKTLNSKVVFPYIAQIKIEYMDNTYDHFVVIKSVSKNKVEIYDPNPANGRHMVKRHDFLKMWTGYVIFLTPDNHFVPKKEKDYFLFKYLPLLLPHKKNLILVCLTSGLLTLFGIGSSFYYKYIIDEVIFSKAAFTLNSISIGILIILLIQSIIATLRQVIINHIVYKADMQINISYIAHLFKLPVSFFDSRRTGEILSRMDDTITIREVLSGITLSIVMDTILIIIVGPVLFSISAKLFFISLSNVLVISLIIASMLKYYRKQYTLLRHQEDGLSSSLVEMIGGAYTIKALNAENTACKDYERNLMRVIWTSWKTNKTEMTQGFFTGIISGITGILVFWIGTSGIINDTLSFGTLLSFNALLGYFTAPIFGLVGIQSELQEASIAAERLSEILEAETEQSEKSNLFKPVALKGDIEFSHVLFRYGMRPLVYNDLSFKISKGQKAAFVGPSGCGKTTIIKLLLKFYNPENGIVTIDNHDLRYIDATALRSHIGYVPQEIFLFSGTIAENIALQNPDSPMEAIVDAAKSAGADSFINNLPEKYNAKLSERGSTLSGGERQRLALARALLSKPDIMILDEATSNLDSISERNIYETIEKLRGNTTTIIIAHRLTTIQNCDVIFVMDKGNILETGTHNELLEKNGLYKKLWDGTTI